MPSFHSLRIASVTQDTAHAIVLNFEVPLALRTLYAHRPGQHLTLRSWIGGEEVRRSYSICEPSHAHRLSVAIKRIPGGVFSTWAHTHLRAQQCLDALPPCGSFGLLTDKQAGTSFLGFSAGSGITPLLSIIGTTLREDARSRFTLLYLNRSLADTMFREALADLKSQYMARLQVVHLFSRERHDGTPLDGRLDTAGCAALLSRVPSLSDIQAAFLCGPSALMDVVSDALRHQGLPAERIRREYFAAPDESASIVTAGAASAPALLAGGQLTITLDGITRSMAMHSGADSILDIALAAGIDVRHACRNGVCATCRCRVVRGEVTKHRQHALSQTERERGIVLSCRSVPLSPDIEVDFDGVDAPQSTLQETA